MMLDISLIYKPRIGPKHNTLRSCVVWCYNTSPRHHPNIYDILLPLLSATTPWWLMLLHEKGLMHRDIDPSSSGAYCIYRPLVMASLADGIQSYTLDTRHPCNGHLCRDCLAGLQFLHQKGIMHRDVKPAKLGVSSFRSLKWIALDHGSATNEPMSHNHMEGIAAFLAPEVCNPESLAMRQEMKAVDHHVSIYCSCSHS